MMVDNVLVSYEVTVNTIIRLRNNSLGIAYDLVIIE